MDIFLGLSEVVGHLDILEEEGRAEQEEAAAPRTGHREQGPRQRPRAHGADVQRTSRHCRRTRSHRESPARHWESRDEGASA